MTGYAQEHIRYTLLDLMKKMPLDSIRVNDLVEKGRINRKTFYYHFHSMEDLLKWVVDQMLWDLPLKDADAGNWKEKTGALLSHIEENKAFYCPLFQSKYGAEISDYLCRKLRSHVAVFIENCRREAEVRRNDTVRLDEKIFNYIVDYYLKGIMSLIEEWISKNCEETPEDFLDIMDNLTKNTIFNVLDAFCPQ